MVAWVDRLPTGGGVPTIGLLLTLVWFEGLAVAASLLVSPVRVDDVRYLVYAAVLDTARRALSGALGLASCVGCAFPLVVRPSAVALNRR